MPHATRDAEVHARLRATLEEIPCVRRAFLENEPPEVFLVCDHDETEPAEALARSVLTEHGLDENTPVHVSYAPAAESRRRVRFVSARLTSPRAGRSRAAVELEWAGRSYVDEAEGESGPALEIRLAALATLQALDGILGGRVRFDLVGIKGVRAFDADVVVALLRSGTASGTHLVGAALATDNLYRSAALAVLNATNRVLGNYLTQG